MNRAAVLLVALTSATGAQPRQASRPASGDRAGERADMVAKQIAARGVKDADVLAAMRSVPRHLFVPSQVVAHAYEDRPLSIGLGQTISQPYIVAYMTDVLGVEPGHRVLEIGTGSGYQAAVLSVLVKQVFSVEIVPELGQRAMGALEAGGYENVTVKIGDGYAGWLEHAPYDRIIVTAAPDHVPAPLVEQLAIGGRLVIPVGPRGGIQELLVIDKSRSGVVRKTTIPVMFVPLTRKP